MIINLNESNDGVFETKWGFVPYSYENYKKLKRINFLLYKAKSIANKWERWVRKDPKNRVYKLYLRNEKGQKIGHTRGDLMPEPKVCDEFCIKVVDVNKNRISGAPYYIDHQYIEYIATHTQFKGTNIIKEYRKARYPRNKEELTKAEFSTQDIDDVLKILEDWDRSN